MENVKFKELNTVCFHLYDVAKRQKYKELQSRLFGSGAEEGID